MIFKKLHVYFFSVLIVFIAAMGFFLYRYNSSKRMIVPEADKFYQQMKNRLQIRGFQFSGYNEEGEKVITIRADKFSVQKKKIGFMTTSLFNVANFKNARIDVYGQGSRSDQNAVSGLKKQLSNLTFKDAFSKGALPALPVKGISSMIIQPVSLNLYVEKSLVTSISANSASLNMKQREIVFQGNVKVISGERSLVTERMNFFLEKAIIKTESHFILKTGAGQSEGAQLSSDIYLEPSTAKDDIKGAGKMN
jgi:hypothetical protein